MTPEDPRGFLPHREPFVFVDEILSREEGKCHCVKTFPPEDPIFRGHFPGNPIVPGVLLTEALAQTAGIAAAENAQEGGFLLSAIRNMKFPSAARPGERMDLLAARTGELERLVIFDVQATIAGRIIAKGSIILNRPLLATKVSA